MLFDKTADNMIRNLVHFLNGKGFFIFGTETYIRDFFKPAVFFAGKGDYLCAAFFCKFSRLYNIRAAAAG